MNKADIWFLMTALLCQCGLCNSVSHKNLSMLNKQICMYILHDFLFKNWWRDCWRKAFQEPSFIYSYFTEIILPTLHLQHSFIFFQM